MEDRKIDYDRGVIINIHKVSGMDVFMYADDPGVYLNAHGGSVSVAIAKEAGYDTEKLEKDRVKKSRKAQAAAMIEAEFADEKDQEENLVIERNGYRVVNTGLGRHHVLDPDGNRLNAHPLSAEVANKLLDGMAGDGEDKKPEVEKPKVISKK